MGAQTDPSIRGGERARERLTTGERPFRQREKKRGKGKDVGGSDIITEWVRLALTQEGNNLRRTGRDFNIF